MKVRNASLTLGLIAALMAVNPSFAQTATPKLVTPIAASAATAVPSLVPYSGTVLAVDGRPPTGDRGITFEIFKEETGGEPLWVESQTVVLDLAGRYTVQLGATSPNGLPTDLFVTGEARWLEVQVAGQPAQPRVLLASVPYALKAADAATLGGLPASAYALAGTRTAAGTAISPAITPDLVSNVTTTGGTSGYVPVFNGASTVIDSPVFVNGANVGIGTVTPSTALDVVGAGLFETGLTVDTSATLNAPLVFTPTGTATATKAYPSQYIKIQTSAYNSSTSSVVAPRFQWQAEVVGNDTATPSVNLTLSSSTSNSAPTQTGFYFNANGTMNFAPGQTFPGVGTITGVTAGTALTGGGTTGNVTLNVDTTKVPLLAATNSFTGNQSITGNETVSGRITSSGSLFLPNTTSPTIGLVELGTTPFLSNYGGTSTFVGGAGNFTTTGSYNVGTGYLALSANTSGVANTANGTFSLYSETTATANTGIGYDSLRNDTTGSDNAALGYAALFNTVGGADNTGVGTEALYYNTAGSSNTAVGYLAGPGSGSTSLSNSTAIGANSIVSQSNSLVLGQTTAGNPGNSFVNVGVGTATPRSIFEAVTTAPEVLGPALTLTNSSANGDFGGASIDFNTYLPSTTGTYNPSSRIEAFGNGGYGDNLEFFSNNDNVTAGPNNGLLLNMVIGANGRVEIGGGDTNPNDYAEHLVVNSINYQGDDEVAAIGAFGSSTTDIGYGTHGIYAVGGDGVGNAQADYAGDGGQFYGGFTPESSSGAPGYGIYAEGGVGGVGVAGDAGHFDGNVTVTGTLTAATKHFKIDHPLDPANKYLVHTSVESSEMMNIYSGNVTTDDLGLATVTLPDWFQAENGDFRYQLTVIGGRFAQAIVSKEISDNKFTISTNATNVKVSWQVTAVRQDAYAKANPMVVEEAKPASERGFYEHPELYGQPAEKQTEWGRRPLAMQRVKAEREARKSAIANGAKGASPQVKAELPASAVNRTFAHPAAPATQLPASGPQLKPISQVETNK